MAVIDTTRTVLRASADACEELKDTEYRALSAKACPEREKPQGEAARRTDRAAAVEQGGGLPRGNAQRDNPGVGGDERQVRPSGELGYAVFASSAALRLSFTAA